MSRPEDIPQDAWDAAEEVWLTLGACKGRDEETAHFARAILAAKAEEREQTEVLTVAVAAVLAEAETTALTMRKRRIFNNMKDRLYAYRNRLALDEVNTAHKNSEEV